MQKPSSSHLFMPLIVKLPCLLIKHLILLGLIHRNMVFIRARRLSRIRSMIVQYAVLGELYFPYREIGIVMSCEA